MKPGLRPLAALALLLGGIAAAPSAIAQGVPATCEAELAKVDETFTETLARLERNWKGDKATKCAAIEHHLEVMRNGIEVFNRCIPEGYSRDENVGQLAVSIDDFLYVSNDQGCE